ncbi:MAG TPA: glycosyltransferase family 2 protein [Steroidobacteraceae bacterium]|nr:glycosyltransferase family 2 protein [Steroidobacteraceae bacterium]
MIAPVLCSIFLGLAVYHYAGYPFAVVVLARLRGKVRLPPVPTDWPSVSLVIAAFNEEKVIAEKIRNSLSLRYPQDRYDIIVVADGSNDSTAQIVNSFADPRVRGLHDPQRRGKSHALNRAVAASQADIVVLSDANNMYSEDALELLVRRLSDATVGGVTGVKKVVQDISRQASTGDGLYWKYESKIKEAESALGGTVTGDGEIFALRREFYSPIPQGVVNDDMYLTLQLVAKGKRVAYEPNATAVEEGSITIREDVNVKIRMIAGGYQGVKHDAGIVFGSGWFTFKFISHKILRWLMPLFLIGLFVSNLFALDQPFFQVVFAGQVILYAGALLGCLLQAARGHASVLYVPFYFVVMNIAAFAGLIRFFKGRQSALWVKAQR